MKKLTQSVLVAMLALAGSQAIAQESPWMVRARAVTIDPANKSTPVGGVGAANAIKVSDKTIPEVDISYFITPNVAAELILTYPQKHSVYLNGGKIGDFRHLPPTLSLQYHFAPQETVRPYVGVGVNYTHLSKVRLLGGAADLESGSWGLSAQVGADIRLTDKWSLNVDLKKVNIRTDVMVGGAKASHLKVDPLLFGVGLGYRF